MIKNIQEDRIFNMDGRVAVETDDKCNIRFRKLYRKV